MREIEVKAKLKDRKLVLERLSALGVSLSSPINQIDQVFFLPGNKMPVDPGVNVLRIRNQEGKLILTLKQPQSNELDCLEAEFEIRNEKEAIRMIKLLGYKEWIEVKKVREKAEYKDMEICLDEVEGLGSYIEVEKIMTTDAEAEIVQKELFSFLKKLGVLEEDQESHGYDVLVAKKKGYKDLR